MSVHLEITTENLLNAVAQMPDGEFNRFIEKAKEIRTERKPLVENDLIHKINTIYPAEKRQRYNRLSKKFEQENTTPKEYQELLKLSDEFEMLNTEKVKYLGELAELRGQTLEQVIDFFQLKILNNS